jgi:uncharacterized repeat protein (TIGR02543 family)
MITITFDENDSDTNITNADPQVILVSIGGRAGNQMPAQPTRSGYSFLGWNTAPNGNGSLFTSENIVSNCITVYAQWLYTPTHRFTLTVTSAHGGTVYPTFLPYVFAGIPVNITAIANSAIRDNWFHSWTVVSGTAVFGDIYNATTTVTLNSDATIRANFAIFPQLPGNLD